MPVNADKQQRIVELVAKIEAEKDQTKFAALVHELNDLVEGEPRTVLQPPSDRRARRETQTA